VKSNGQFRAETSIDMAALYFDAQIGSANAQLILCFSCRLITWITGHHSGGKA